MSVDVIDENGEVVRETSSPWTRRRYLLVFLAFFGFINIYTLRFNLSVGIVAMTDNKTISHSNATHNWTTYEREFDWSSEQQGLVLSSFFYGYICTQVWCQLIVISYQLNNVIDIQLSVYWRLCCN